MRCHFPADCIIIDIYCSSVLSVYTVWERYDEMTHLGVDRTLDLVRLRFYWPRMAADVEQKINTCGCCFHGKTLLDKTAPLVNI